MRNLREKIDRNSEAIGNPDIKYIYIVLFLYIYIYMEGKPQMKEFP